MWKILASTTLLICSLLFLVQCSDDETVMGTDTGSKAFEGITITSEAGTVMGGDSDDWCYIAGTPKASDLIPNHYSMYPAFPNPCYDNISFQYDLPLMVDVYITIVNVSGDTVRTLAYYGQAPGTYTLDWDLRDNGGTAVTPGIYHCLLEAGDFSCSGDIEVTNNIGRMVLVSEISNNQLTVTYDASTPIGGVLLLYDANYIAGPIAMGDGASNMVVDTGTVNGTFRIFVVPDIVNYVLDGEHTLLTVPVSADMSLDSVDVSDIYAHVLPGFILNK
jgi:hypothetical protein